MRAFALIFFAVGAPDAWALLDARRVRRSNRLLSTANFGQLKVTANDAAYAAKFGSSVAIDGDTVVIGATGAGTGGAVYVLRTSDGGATYDQVAKLMASDGATYDRFGYSVAIDGDTVVVGAYAPSSVGGSGWGSAYVFHTSDDWATHTEIKLTATDAAASDKFGYSVAIDGGTIVVGAYGDDDDGSLSGSAYVFRTSDGGTTYPQVAKLTAADAAVGDVFGYSVAIAGDTIVIGAINREAAYVFRTTNGGATYGQVAKLTASDAGGYDNFGFYVAIDGGTVVVGARYAGIGGAAYVSRTSDGGATYDQVAMLTASDAASSDYFGASVAISGDTIVIGASGDDDGADSSGSAYVFRTTDDGATYDQVAKLTAADAAWLDNFGKSVAIDEGTLRSRGRPRQSREHGDLRGLGLRLLASCSYGAANAPSDVSADDAPANDVAQAHSSAHNAPAHTPAHNARAISRGAWIGLGDAGARHARDGPPRVRSDGARSVGTPPAIHPILSFPWSLESARFQVPCVRPALECSSPHA